MSESPSTNELEAFLKVSKSFALGNLETEAQHPLTMDLAHLASSNLSEAYDILLEVDKQALALLHDKLHQVAVMGGKIHECLNASGRIFLCGCGATGRLSISLEVFCRMGLIPAKWKSSIISFMAGGDAALIKSIEKFEDYPEYGARQLRELGFGTNDLLIASTEGGETPWVIGATEEAVQLSQRPPWFLYCNPDELLCLEVERSRRVIECPDIQKLNLSVGPMALSGSTRMQASTVLMLSIGWALEHGSNHDAICKSYQRFIEALDHWPWDQWQEFAKAEACLYSQGAKTIYQTNSLGVTLLTDTTERSPTFSLPAYENNRHPEDELCLCYLSVIDSISSSEAWEKLLLRAPRCLEWDDTQDKTGQEQLLGFDISDPGYSKNKARTPFMITESGKGITCRFLGNAFLFDTADLGLLETHSLLKIALNNHSTLVMGRLGRFEGNIMTFVKPSNNKLIDRSIRYIQQLAKYRKQPVPDYSTAAALVFNYLKTASNKTSVIDFVLSSKAGDTVQ